MRRGRRTALRVRAHKVHDLCALLNEPPAQQQLRVGERVRVQHRVTHAREHEATLRLQTALHSEHAREHGHALNVARTRIVREESLEGARGERVPRRCTDGRE